MSGFVFTGRFSLSNPRAFRRSSSGGLVDRFEFHRDTRSSIALLFLFVLVICGWASIPFVIGSGSSRPVFVAMFLISLPALSKLTVQLLAAVWHALQLLPRAPSRAARYTPVVSVIVPAWNEEIGVLVTLRSLLRSTYRPMEVIVVNDGSTDGTDSIVRDFLNSPSCRNSDIPIVYRAKENGGKGTALNEGIRSSRGDIVVTIDADSAVLPDTIGYMVEPFRDPSVMSVAGNVRIGNRSTILGVIQQMEYLYGFFFKRADSVFDSMYIVGGAAAAYRRSVFSLVGDFDESIITEDIELSTRIQAAGFRIRYAPQALVYTEGPTDFGGLCRQRLRWKYGRFLTFWKYRHLFLSTARRHSLFLTFVSLPIALLTDILLPLQWVFLAFSIAASYALGNAWPILWYAMAIAFLVAIQVMIDARFRDNRNLLIFAPVSALMFLVVDAIETRALFQSVSRFLRREGIVWQKWTRTGVFGSGAHVPLAGDAGDSFVG